MKVVARGIPHQAVCGFALRWANGRDNTFLPMKYVELTTGAQVTFDLCEDGTYSGTFIHEGADHVSAYLPAFLRAATRGTEIRLESASWSVYADYKELLDLFRISI